jgi:hypothetical protein
VDKESIIENPAQSLIRYPITQDQIDGILDEESENYTQLDAMTEKGRHRWINQQIQAYFKKMG